MKTEITSDSVTQSSGSNFVASFWFLPKEKRRALTVIYAYCRLTDDLVDLAPSRDQAKSELKNWRVELEKSWAGNSTHPVLKELAEVAAQYKIPHEYFSQLIDGVEMDLHQTSYERFEDLYRYCYLVASVVGLMCLEVFEYRDPRSKQFAIDLGIAFQITNILRDLRTDAERRRTYLPQEDLKKFNLSMEDFANPAPEKFSRFRDLILFECNRAETYYAQAKKNLVASDRKNLIAAEIMCAVYHAILRRIQKNPLQPLTQKVRIPRIESFFRIAQGWLTNRMGL